MDYYQKKEKEVNELRKRGTNKKNITYIGNKGNNKITELRTILQRESQNS